MDCPGAHGADAGFGTSTVTLAHSMTDERFQDEGLGETIDSLPWLGVNFWSRAGGPRMWARYDGASCAKSSTCSPSTVSA